jgi:hypothetical protein
VRELDATDGLLFLFVHTAKHGARRLKWLLDLYAVALRADQPTWRLAARRAAAGGVRRPFFAAASLVASLPNVAIEAEALKTARPPFHVRKLLGALITREGAVQERVPAQWEQYAFELLLEESVRARVRLAGGFSQRRVRWLLVALRPLRSWL